MTQAANTFGEDLVEATFTFHEAPLETAPQALAPLRRSDDAADDFSELRRRMHQDGYLFLPGHLDRQGVLAARHTVTQRLADTGLLAPDRPTIDCIAAANTQTGFMAELAQDNPELDRVLYAGPMMDFYHGFLDGPVRPFDYTWFRAKSPGGNGTQPHYDVVYMGRGTRRLYTSWTPLGDITLDMGGLMILEGSHQQQELIATYGQQDVDRYCENDPASQQLVEQARSQDRNLTGQERGQVQWQSPTFGSYSADAVSTRQKLGGRWLTAPYQMGDLLVFSMYTMHASPDNHTDQIRLSSDSRYQLASEPVDERWIGADPPGHGIRAHRGMIC
ncbi:MAG: phytanoyl-CoA dioxygenase [Candidatus Latescibacteria bacterium]|nr:phytanoyl-CoA dioxygenase [Candidatus Latescibacterota bacterium]